MSYWNINVQEAPKKFSSGIIPTVKAKETMMAAPSRDVGDVIINGQNIENSGIHKAYIPEFLYKPPFGYPRKENLPLAKNLSQNGYVFSVIKTICDEAVSNKYDIRYKEESEMVGKLDEQRLEILRFFDNPNRNKESFSHILRCFVRDICEVDTGVIVKVFNRYGKLVEMFARDGASFLKNPDPYGYMGYRSDIIIPSNLDMQVDPAGPDWNAAMNQYSLEYKEQAAYFQYGMTGMALPVPFGRREVIFAMQNPRSDSIYGTSPILILATIINSLVFGSNYNLDYYVNNNMPEGILSLVGVSPEEAKAVKQRIEAVSKVYDENLGVERKIGFKVPVTDVEAKFTSLMMDPRVMQILEQQQWFTKLVWACFGVTPDEMGFTENSNKAVSEQQGQVNKRKAVKPILALIKYHIDKEIIAEWGQEVYDNLEFVWDDYDLDEDIKKHTLYQMQISMGIKTPEMVAKEEGIDVEELKESKQDNLERQQELMGNTNDSFNNGNNKDSEDVKDGMRKKEKEMNKDDPSIKSFVKTDYDNTDFEEELVNQIKAKAVAIKKALHNYNKGTLENVR